MSDPENTFRALKGEPLFVDRWQCQVGLHRWGRWTEPKKNHGEVYFRQHRVCVDCSKVNVSKVKMPI